MTASYSQGIHIGRLKTLTPILYEWQKLNERIGSYWAKCYDDAPWWYNERASLSFFAGAVWRCPDGWAIEEFSTTKTAISKHGRKQEHVGRCDINFGIGNYVFTAEVKQCWPNVGDAQKAIKKIDNALQVAHQDCLQLPNLECPRLGMVFAVPMLHKSKQEHIEDALLRAELFGGVRLE